MRRFNFTSAEIDAHKSDRRTWSEFVRRHEANITFSLFPDTEFSLALELGAGNGAQSVTIAKYCKRLICTELDEQSYSWLGESILDRDLPNVDYRLCDAQDLSQFEDKTFDLVFSSNMLEHIPDVDRCLSECKRVLKDDGLMLHTMPSRWWKAFSFSLSLAKLRRPGVHGVSSNSVAEFSRFGRRVWKSKFQANGFRVDETVALPFYVGHGNTFIWIIKAGNLLHLPASFLYIVRKQLAQPAGAAP